MRATARLLAAALLLAANLLSCSRDDQLRLPRRVVDLSPALTQDLNVRRLGSRVLEFLATDGRISCDPILPRDRELAYGLDEVCLPSHSGAHLDAPARLLRGGEHPAQVNLERLLGPARVVDLRWHDRDSPLQIPDLELVPIAEGDVVILFVGYEPPGGAGWPEYPPISRQASEWLAAKRVRAVATDMPAITRHEEVARRLRAELSAEQVWAEYIPLFQAQIPVVAGLVNLESIAGESNVLFLGLPLPLTTSGGAPARAVALVY